MQPLRGWRGVNSSLFSLDFYLLVANYIRAVKFSKQVFWLLPVLWGAWIIYLSLLPGNSGMLTWFGIPHFDKVAHLGAYGVWSFLFLFAAQKTLGYCKQRMWQIVGLLILVGCGLEFGQYYMHEGRSFEVLDMVANSLGSISGAFIERFIFKKKKGMAN